VGQERDAISSPLPLPPPPPLFLAVSELLVPRPGYWPESAQLIGFLSVQEV
jgi:hypothetical protein